MKGIYVVVPIWGETYTQRWLELSLASLMADGNLPALARSHTVKFLLCTTMEDSRRVLATPALKALRQICGIRVVPIATTVSELAQLEKHKIMTACHNHALTLSRQDDYGVIFLVGNSLFADGSMRGVMDLISAGKRAALIQGGGSVSQELLDDLLRPVVERNEIALTIKPRDLVRVTLQAMHPTCRFQIWDSPRSSSHPSMMYWRLGEQGLLMRCWTLYPLFLYPDRDAKIEKSIDTDLIEKAVSNPDDLGFVDDSDQCLFVDVAEEARLQVHPDIQFPSLPMPANIEYIARWCSAFTTPSQRELIRRHKYWIHTGIDRREWAAVEAESDHAVAAILAEFEQLPNKPVPSFQMSDTHPA